MCVHPFRFTSSFLWLDLNYNQFFFPWIKLKIHLHGLEEKTSFLIFMTLISLLFKKRKSWRFSFVTLFFFFELFIHYIHLNQTTLFLYNKSDISKVLIHIYTRWKTCELNDYHSVCENFCLHLESSLLIIFSAHEFACILFQFDFQFMYSQFCMHFVSILMMKNINQKMNINLCEQSASIWWTKLMSNKNSMQSAHRW